MAYSIIKQGDTASYGYVELIIDTLTEVTELPTDYAPGSTAICVQNSSVWILGNDREWHEL